MPEQRPLTIRIPIKGKLLIKLDGFGALHEVGTFTKELNVSLSTAGGNVDFQFDEDFWAATIKDRGVEPPTPQDVALDTTAILQVLETHVQSVRNNRCECGWRPTNESIINPAGAQHRLHLAQLLAAASA
jgi:hypothetical protein